MTLSNFASGATIGAFIITLFSIAFSAKRYLNIREKEQASERFTTYHNLIKTISKGTDNDGILKLVSQIAYIYELRQFQEYAELTEEILNKLREEWVRDSPDPKKYESLKKTIDETLAELQNNKKLSNLINRTGKYVWAKLESKI